MKRFAVLLISVLLCVALCSCSALEDFDLKEYIKSVIGNDDDVSRDEGYIETLENDEYSYEVYEDHVLLSEYIAEVEPTADIRVTVPREIDGKPVTVIGPLCFYYLKNISQISVSDTVTRFSDSAFYHCDGLKSLTVPAKVQTIGERCFAWCEALTSIKLPSGITAIPDYCFNSCTMLDGVTIPASVTSIGTRAFSYCASLSEIVIPEGVTSIGERAFSKCDKLKYVTVPSSVTSIGGNVFEGSDNVVVIAEPNSEAAKYCRENGIALYGEAPPEVSEESVDASGAESSEAE